MKRKNNRIKTADMIKKLGLMAMFGILSGTVVAQEAASAAANTVPGDKTVGLMIGLALFQLIIIMVIANAIKNIAKSTYKKNDNVLKAIVSLFFIGGAQAAFAQDASVVSEPWFVWDNTSFYVLVTLNIVLFLVILSYAKTLLTLTRSIYGLKDKSEEVVPVEEVSVFEKVSLGLTDVVAVEDEESILMDHEYDGIQELDNNLPPWWKWMFYLCIVWAFIHVIDVHLLETTESQADEFKTEMAEADIQVAAYKLTQKKAVDEYSVIQLVTESALKSGKKVYNKNCGMCHGEEGQGVVGPNFADEYWIHGGSVNDIFKTVKYGVTVKGMKAWDGELSPAEIQNVSSYLMTFAGTNPENQKDAEGELYVPEASVTESTEE